MPIDQLILWIFVAGLLAGAGITLLVAIVIPNAIWIFRYLRQRRPPSGPRLRSRALGG